MNSITFIKGDVKKNTIKDFQMILISGGDGDGKKNFTFIMRYGSVPIANRLAALKDFLNDPVDAYFDDLTSNKFKATWTVENLGNQNGAISVGDTVILSYPTVVKTKETKETKEVKEVKEIKEAKPKEEVPEVKKDMPKEAKKENKAKAHKEITVEGVE